MLPFSIISNTNIIPVPTTTITNMEASADHVHILYSNGELYARGQGSGYKLGTGNTSAAATWTLVNTGVRLFSTNIYGTFVVKYDGTIWMVGRQSFYLGTTLTTINQIWTDVSSYFSTIDITAITDIKLSTICIMILLGSGQVYGIGLPNSQQLGGNNTAITTLSLRSSTNVATRIYSSLSGTAYLTNDGRLFRAGDNQFGQLGSGATTIQAYATTLSTAYVCTDCYLGSYHSSILAYSTSSPTVSLYYSSGSGTQGARGDNSTTATTQFSNYVPLNSVLKSFGNNKGVKYYNTFAIGTAGGLYSTGYNSGGLRGNGTSAGRNVFLNDSTGFENASDIKFICSVNVNGTFMVSGYYLYYTGPGSSLGLTASTIFYKLTDTPY